MSRIADASTERAAQSHRVTGQIALYALRQPSLSSVIEASMRIFRKHGLDVQLGPMSTLVSGDSSAVFRALRSAFEASANQAETVMVATLSNACPMPGRPDAAVSCTAIGHVENEFDEPAPPETLRAAVSRIVIDPALVEGLTGLEPGGQVTVLFSFHRSAGYELLQHPRGDQSRTKRGVFALRSPHRPNPIGVTAAELLAVEGNVLTVRGLDAINGTPVLDLKPE
jgi:tRNA-Thr(GGU) m(6)t(6)A37 methyltransferase TsaA